MSGGKEGLRIISGGGSLVLWNISWKLYKMVLVFAAAYHSSSPGQSILTVYRSLIPWKSRTIFPSLLYNDVLVISCHSFIHSFIDDERKLRIKNWWGWAWSKNWSEVLMIKCFLSKKVSTEWVQHSCDKEVSNEPPNSQASEASDSLPLEGLSEE